MKVSTTSGAMNSAEPTGVLSIGVVVGVGPPLDLLITMLLRSKSHILIGTTWEETIGKLHHHSHLPIASYVHVAPEITSSLP